MKGRFSTIDIKSIVKELQRFLGMRVLNVYDVDNKTYLIRIAKPDEKGVILVESGTRLHSTDFDWPKHAAPSGFSMKLRKHLKGRRLEHVCQLGVDRIVDLQFGSGEAAYHVLVEMYDRGNIVLTDFEYTILNILRPRTDDSQDVHMAVRETYPIHAAIEYEPITEESVLQLLMKSKDGDILKKIFISHLVFGPAIIEHCLLMAGFAANIKIGNGFTIATHLDQLMEALRQGEMLFLQLSSQPNKGYIIQRTEKRANVKDGESADLLTYDEFHPYLFQQYMNRPYLEFDTFAKAVDEFYSQLESQKLDLKVVQQEKSALKKLENVRKDHDKRILELKSEQELDIKKGELIELNLQLVDRAIAIVRSALANQIDWTEIRSLVKEAQLQGDPVAMSIKGLKLDTNHITLLLRNPYLEHCDDASLAEHDRPQKVDVDLALSAYANSKRFFDMKRHAATKEQKTVDASSKALKSAERKTKQTLKDVATAATINKARKTFWFEKFLWFISSENYMVIGGRDQQQNELIVKRYFRAGDVYVHADLHGASSVIIKNTTGETVPPKTLTEAGTMALCHSAAWDAKVVTSAWWVLHDQVSKTAPTGEYLTTGSFMIRGKKNYLPPSHLVYGFGLLFRLEEGSIFRHIGERKIRSGEDDASSVADSIVTEGEVDSENLSDVPEEGDEDADNIRSDEESDSDDDNYQVSQEETDQLDDVRHQSQLVNKDSSGPTTAIDTAVKNEVEDENTEEQKNDDSDNDNLYPDTTITLQHVTENRFSLQRSTSVGSSCSLTSGPEIEDTSVSKGCGVTGLHVADAVTVSSGRLSAKQRRELKKVRKGHSQPAQELLVSQSHPAPISEVPLLDEDDDTGVTDHKKSQPQQQLRRGQKSKLKKIRDKYGDQDDEERQLRIEILASSGPQKPDKKAKKGKAGNTKGGQGGQPLLTKGGQGGQSLQQQNTLKGKLPLQTIKPASGDLILQPEPGDLNSRDSTIKADATHHDGADGKAAPKTNDVKVEQDNASDDEEPQDEETQIQQQTDDTQVMDSLTGCPLLDDELLFAIPVCAPYQTMHNYKFKIKLLPGSTKRGKAAKSALNMFLYDKSIVVREKDLLRILKDVDISRNIPGKVKLAASNLQKQKKKK